MNQDASQQVDLLFWRMALKDDKKAFEELFNMYFAPLCIFARRFVEDPDCCEDLVQNVFFRLWKDRKQLDIKSSVKNYLVTNVRNECIDFIRHREVENTYILKHDRRGESEEIYTTFDLEELLRRALDKLPENVRNTFVMSRFEGKTYPEIAERHGISVKTVESHITKALKLLRVELKEILPNGGRV